MPAQISDKRLPPASEPASPLPARGKSTEKWLMGGIVLIVVVVPAIVTYLLLPQPASTDASRQPAGDKPAAAGSHDPAGETHSTGIAEVSLGEFKISNGTAVPGMTIDVEFKLAAVTAAEQAQRLEAEVKTHTARIRQAVNAIVRTSRIEELSDSRLEKIRHLIHEDVNRLLGKNLVGEVTITDVTVTEQ